MKNKFLILISAILLVSQITTAQVGTTGLSFLKTGVSARSVGMGDIMNLDKPDAASLFYNPASIGLTANSQLTLMHREWISDTRTEYLGAVIPYGKFRFGVGINLTSVDNIELRTVPGPAEGTFSSKNSAISLSTSYPIDSFTVGLTAKFLYEKIFIDEATGYGFDIGTIYNTPWNIPVGFSLNNIGSMNTLRNETSLLPTMVRIGSSKTFNFDNLNSSVIAGAEVISILKEHAAHIHFGVEFNYHEILFLRAGIQTGYEAKFFSTGAGFKYNIFIVDYAFVPFKYDFGSTHTIAILINL